MDIETVQNTEGQKEEEKKAYEARIEATKVPTPDELAARVCSHARILSLIRSNSH